MLVGSVKKFVLHFPRPEICQPPITAFKNLLECLPIALSLPKGRSPIQFQRISCCGTVISRSFRSNRNLSSWSVGTVPGRNELTGATEESLYQPCAAALLTFINMYMTWNPTPFALRRSNSTCTPLDQPQ